MKSKLIENHLSRLQVLNKMLNNAEHYRNANLIRFYACVESPNHPQFVFTNKREIAETVVKYTRIYNRLLIYYLTVLNKLNKVEYSQLTIPEI